MRRISKNLALKILLDPHLLSPPETDTTDGAESKQHTECDAQAPDGLHLVASGLAGAGPDVVVDLGEVVADRVDERGRGARGRQSCAVEVRERLAHRYGYDDPRRS